jgi:hypothetical protein
MWERWQTGESLQHTAQSCERNLSSTQRILAETHGILRASRHRAQETLTLAIREDISRVLAVGDTIQSIAKR